MSPLSDKRTVPAFTGAEASATACFSHGRRFSHLPLHPQAFPLEGSAVLNDTPVACQTRRPTDPQGDRCPHIPAALAATYPLRCFAPQWARFDNRHSTSAPTPTLTAVSGSRRRGYFAPRRERFLCLRRPHFFQQRKKWEKERRQKLRFCTSSARYTRL